MGSRQALSVAALTDLPDSEPGAPEKPGRNASARARLCSKSEVGAPVTSVDQTAGGMGVSAEAAEAAAGGRSDDYPGTAAAPPVPR